MKAQMNLPRLYLIFLNFNMIKKTWFYYKHEYFMFIFLHVACQFPPLDGKLNFLSHFEKFVKIFTSVENFPQTCTLHMLSCFRESMCIVQVCTLDKTVQ